MPYISCRDTLPLQGCDYFIREKDPREVQIKIFTHVMNFHAEESMKLFKNVAQGKVKFSQFNRAHTEMIRWEPGDTKVKTRIACADLVGNCPTVIDAPDFFEAQNLFFEHLEDSHPQFLLEQFKQGPTALFDNFIKAAKYEK